jgi:Skp family chaperone for outer membrane proteins
VNLNLLVREMPQTMVAQKALNQQLSGRKKLLLKQLAEIGKLRRTMHAQESHANLLQRMENEQRLNSLRQGYRTSEQQYEEDFNLARNQALANLQRLAIHAIRAYGKRHHFTVILGREVFFASPEINLTSRILEQLRLMSAHSRKHG